MASAAEIAGSTEIAMKEGAWTAVMTLGTMEYVVQSELNRVGLSPYLAQRKAQWTPNGCTKPMVRRIPIFPKYVFLPVAQARLPQLHFCRGLPGHKYLLTSPEGTIWTVPADVIFSLAKAENEGRFDEVPPELGDRVRLRGASALSSLELLVNCLDDRTAQVFSRRRQSNGIHRRTGRRARSQATPYAGSARHSANAIERLCL
jgi:hypothetical protein